MNENFRIKLMSIREIAKTGIIPEYALRRMVKEGTIPCIYSGKKCLINLYSVIDLLNGSIA